MFFDRASKAHGLSMPDCLMTLYAFNGIRSPGIAVEHVVCHSSMTINAVVLQYHAVFFCDHYWFVKVLESKSPGVVVPVFSFRYIFIRKILRQVALHAVCGGLVAGLQP